MNLSYLVNTELAEISKSVQAYPLKDPTIIRRHSNTVSRVISSIGIDGKAYGVELTGKLFRTGDGMDSFEYGQDMSLLVGWVGSVSNVCQTYSGYLVVERKVTPLSSSLWWSSSFNAGFTKIADLTNGYTGELGFSIYNGDNGRSVILCGEYSTAMATVGNERRVFASYDGGQTFSVIFTSAPKSYTINCHIHATLFDPYDNRIYVSVGDGVNAGLYYSDNYGTTWFEIPLEYNNIHQQPTVLIATPERLLMLPDGQTSPGVFSITKDRKFTIPGTEKFVLKYDYSTLPNVTGTGAGSFSIAPYATDSSEIYWVVPGFSDGSIPMTLVGSGDGGKNWFNLFSTRKLQSKRGIVGPDQNGYYFIGCLTATTVDTFVLLPPVWAGNVVHRKQPVNKILKTFSKQPVANRVFGSTTVTFVDDSTINSIVPLPVTDWKNKSILIKNDTTVAIAQVDIYATYGTSANSPMIPINKYASGTLIPSGTSKLFNSIDPELSLLSSGFMGLIIKIGFYAGGTGTYDITIVGGN